MVQRPDGNGGVEKFSFKDVKELEKNDADAYRMYDKFFDRFNGIRIEIAKGQGKR